MNLLRYFNIMIILNIIYISNAFSSNISQEEKESRDSLKISQKFSPQLEKQINELREKSGTLINLKEKLTPETQKEEEIIMKKQLKVLIEEVLSSLEKVLSRIE